VALQEAVVGATTGAGMGAMSGTPHGVAIGAVTGFVGGLFSGGGDDNGDHARALRRKTHKQNKENWKFNNEEGERKQEFAEESLKIRKENDKENIEFQEGINQQNYDFGMSVRKYEFDQANKAYMRSVDDAGSQVDFNRMAKNIAMKQQSRAHSEQLMGLMFDEQQTLLDYNIKAAGLGNDQQRVFNKSREMTAGATFTAQNERLQGLKLQGTAAAAGSGRSNAKAMQAAIAESGANQAQIAEELMFGLRGIQYDLNDIESQTGAMNEQLILDKAMLVATRDNVSARNSMVKNQIKFDQLQADRQALASIRMQPEINPPLPKPISLPRPEYQDIYEYKAPPKPKRGAGQSIGSTGSTSAGLIPTLMSGIQTLSNSGIFSGGSGYAGNKTTEGAGWAAGGGGGRPGGY
jgi:hypothetical protein